MRRSALFNRADVAISSPCVALSRSGPRNRAVRWKLPSLFKTMPGATNPAQGSQSASSAGRWRYSARFSIASSSPHTSSSGRCLMCRAKTSMNCGSTRAPQLAIKWPTTQTKAPGNPIFLPTPTKIDHGGVISVEGKYLKEMWIDGCAPLRQGIACEQEHGTRNLGLQSQPHSGSQVAVGNLHGGRRTAQQDRLGERAVHRQLEPGREGIRGAHTTAPPEKLKNDRKKLEAANAMVRPNTIWNSLRTPPDVSPKTSASSVRSDERRVGKECVSTCRIRCCQSLENKK